jgi:hypothetical protein
LISGAAQVGQTLTTSNGSWTGSPTGYTYVWQRCDASGNNCGMISSATSQSYRVASADVGSTIEAWVTAYNSVGSATAKSAPTAIVPTLPSTFGKTSVGAVSDRFASDRKRVNRYALTTGGTVTKLSLYLQATSTGGQQVMQGVIYADSGGSPGSLLATTKSLTFTSTSPAGWYDLTFPTPPHLAAGNYWIGVLTGATYGVAGYRYDSVSGSRDYNSNTYTAGPSDPFGPVTVDGQQMSLYATYTAG